MKPVHPAVLPADWPAPPGVRAFTTLRHGAGVSQAPFDTFNLGARCDDAPDAVASNRAELASHFGLPSPPHWLRQTHGIEVARFDVAGAHLGATEAARDSGSRPGALLQGEPGSRPGALLQGEPEADAAVTSVPGTVLAILTADCLPVVFADDNGSEVAAAHAGWRGLVAGVLESTVSAMRTPPARLLAWLGPAAGPAHYEVGQEVHDAFVSRDPASASAFASTRPGHWRVDLYALARMRLADAGIAPDRIHGGGLCTIGDPARFYSHRRDQRTGRMATLVWIESSP